MNDLIHIVLSHEVRFVCRPIYPVIHEIPRHPSRIGRCLWHHICGAKMVISRPIYVVTG